MTGCAYEAVFVCVCACPGVGPSAAGVSPSVAVGGTARCTFASHCKVRADLVAQCQNGGQEDKQVGGCVGLGGEASLSHCGGG